MFIALTGTPGTGKSTVSIELERNGYQVLDLNQIAIERHLLTNFDDMRHTYEIDIDALNDYLLGLFEKNNDQHSIAKKNKYQNVSKNKENTIFLEGHISHLLDFIDLVIILRCNPVVLHKRLELKKWSKKKILENLEAEVVDVITFECVDNYDNNKIFEIDTTNSTPEKVVDDIISILAGSGTEFLPGNIDWSEEILKWY